MGQYRWCGRSRTPGAVYHTTKPEEMTADLDDGLFFFLFCPPKGPIYPEQLNEMGVSAVSAALIEDPDEPGLWHVLDIVGREHYRYWPDFVEESRVLGLSRLFTKTLPLDRLTPMRSKHILLHAAGWLHNHQDYYSERVNLFDCPRPDLAPEHTRWNVPAEEVISPLYMCQSLLWQAVDEAHSGDGRRFQRMMPSGHKYTCAQSPAEIRPAFTYAVMGELPITRFEIPVDEEAGQHEKTMARLKKLNISVPYVVTED